MPLDIPHHDGSPTFVRPSHPALGELVTLRVRVPHGEATESVHVRYGVDGEPTFRELERVAQDGAFDLWQVELEMPNPTMHYRFVLAGGPTGYSWLNGTGLHTRDVPDAADFRLASSDEPPAWSREAVVYQIFPDRFARSSEAGARRLPGWAIPHDWDDPLDHDTPGRGSEVVYGGDLRGIIEHLDHIESLGANVIYLTPFFEARSNHRYDAVSFERVDPLLGGDEALVELVEAAHARGMRVLGDITTNHTGVEHEWFRAALADPEAPERDFYLFDDSELGYAAWLDVPSLPKLNYSSAALLERMFGPDGPIRRFLREPFDLDGWRVDVANMTGRHRGQDHNQLVAQTMRSAVAAEGDKLLIAEHTHDISRDMDGLGWHGAMNYSGSTRPLWTWLRGLDEAPRFLGSPLIVPRLGGTAVAETMQEFSAQMPWTILRHSMNLSGSHDTTRVMSLTCGDRRMAAAAAAMVHCLPGIPMVCYGDEIGMEGRWGEDGRRPFPWQLPESWDTDLLELYRTLGRLRHEHSCLRDGGMEFVACEDDVIVWLRQSPDESALVVVRRAGHDELRLPLDRIAAARHGSAVIGEGISIDGNALRITDDGGPVTIWVW